MSRSNDIDKFYRLIDKIEEKIDQKHLLLNCNGKMDWPKRGVYFFFEKDELRDDGSSRIVRIGTHALKPGSKTTLWDRLRQHRGNIGGSHPGGGNHRGSIFRLHVGSAIISKKDIQLHTWSKGNTARSEIRQQEYPIEQMVSNHICAMPFLWLKIDDTPGPFSDRGVIERNSIALVSNYRKQDKIDPFSKIWLGNYSVNEKIRLSGLWNVEHVDENYNPDFLKILERYVEEM